MVSIYDLKPRFQDRLRPAVERCAACGITPNQITSAALVLSLFCGLIVLAARRFCPLLLLVPLMLFARMALNAIDGMLAREHNMQTRLGAVLNELGDVVSDTVIYLPLAAYAELPAALVTVCVLSAVIIEFTGVLAGQLSGQRAYNGPMGKSDRAFAFGALCLILGLGIPPGQWSALWLWVILILSVWTIVNRAKSSLRETAA